MLTRLLQDRGFSVRKKTAGEMSSACPWCGGEDRFCVFLDQDRYWCRRCNRGGDAIQFLRELDGLSFKEAAEALGRGNNGDRAQAKPTKKGSPGTFIAAWVYLDEEGKPLFQVQRYNTEKGKSFKQFPYNGNGALEKKPKAMDGIRRVLYRLPDLLKYSTAPVWICEGEKAADLLHSIDLRPAVCNPGGAGKWPGLAKDRRFEEPLRGRVVYILPDNDKAGRDHAEQVAASLYGKAREVKILPLPYVADKGDVVDLNLLMGPEDTVKTLLELTEQTAPWRPPRNFFSAEDLLSLSFEKRPPIIGAGIMPYGSHIIISGEAGVGKSLLRQELALHLVMGWQWLGFEIPKARRVVVFQWENSEAMEQARLRRMCHGLGITSLPKGRLVYVDRKNRIDLTLKKDRGRLLDLVRESEGEVIVYDCLSNLHSGKENDNIQMREVLDSLTEINANLGTSCVVIHHFGKPTEGQAASYRTRGASSIIDWAVTAAAYTAKPHESRTLRLLEFFKVRDGARPKPIMLERDENFLLQIVEEDTLCPPGKVREILEDLGGEVDRQKELAEAIRAETGCSPRSAATFIRAAVAMKTIYEAGGGQGRAKGYRT